MEKNPNGCLLYGLNDRHRPYATFLGVTLHDTSNMRFLGQWLLDVAEYLDRLRPPASVADTQGDD